jgi:hypothetical protein
VTNPYQVLFGVTDYSITSINIHPSTKIVLSSGFFWSEITSIVIPASVTYVEPKRLRYLNNLTSISVNEANVIYYSLNDNTLIEKGSDRLIFSLNGNIPEGIKIIGPYALSNKDLSLGITIPDSVVEIEEYAFYFVDAPDTLVIPDSVTKIGKGAFSYCMVKSLTISNSLKVIEEDAFNRNMGVNVLNLPSSITMIKKNAFYDCTKIHTINFNANLVFIDEYAFGNTYELTSITLPDNLKVIHDFAFYSAYQVEQLNINKRLRYLSGCAFYFVNLYTITCDQKILTLMRAITVMPLLIKKRIL